jgi:hypothetical protein
MSSCTRLVFNILVHEFDFLSVNPHLLVLKLVIINIITPFTIYVFLGAWPYRYERSKRRFASVVLHWLIVFSIVFTTQRIQALNFTVQYWNAIEIQVNAASNYFSP